MTRQEEQEIREEGERLAARMKKGKGYSRGGGKEGLRAAKRNKKK